MPAFTGQPLERPTLIFNEHESNGLVIDGDWKLVANKVTVRNGPKEELWELYNLKEDRTELNNLAKQMPERASEMAAAWKSWAEKANVFPKPKPGTKPQRKQAPPRKRRGG